LVAACHDCSDGGLAAAVAEMAIGGGLGGVLDLARVPMEFRETAAATPALRDLAVAFNESPGRFVCEVRPGDAAGFEAAMAGLPWAWIGAVEAGGSLRIESIEGRTLADVPVERLAGSWRGPPRP
ncbi:MAG: phosphoribosylformylglycinamidine synthase, partial [Planctomycetia bacterium]|nr:phosphoribosylformylglycinamidine synthase [Planctomycetia bacterium]